jgi:hypothetical protein
MKKPQKITIREKLNSISAYDLSLSKEEAFSAFCVTPKHHYESIDIDFVVNEKIWGTEYSLELYGFREETDEEFKERISLQKQINLKNKKNLKLQQEKELYERLKKKFEN